MTKTRSRRLTVTARESATGPQRAAFTLIELLVVISIITLLISLLMPSLSRARDQAKGVHCLARLKDMGNAIAAYEGQSHGMLPAARWYPNLDEFTGDDGQPLPEVNGGRPIEYGWTEVLFAFLYKEEVHDLNSYTVQRNLQAKRFGDYFLCRAVGDKGINSGHYRVYLPAWSAASYTLEPGRVYGESTRANPLVAAPRESIRPKMPLIGDANDQSERGDGQGDDDCSFIDAGEANYAGSDGRHNGNRFDDRHHGGTNYLFQGLHAEWRPKLREELSRDYDLNGVEDIELQPE